MLSKEKNNKNRLLKRNLNNIRIIKLNHILLKIELQNLIKTIKLIN